MQNKALSLFLFMTTCMIQGIVWSQNTETSPYSSYGIGLRDGVDNAAFSGLGNTTITYFDSTTLNYFNPASYNTMAKGQPLFSTGLSSRLSFYTEGNENHFDKSVVLNHFAMGCSFAKHFGLAFGLRPFTRRGYSFTVNELLVTDSVRHQYNGSGSTNEVFFGLSSNLLKFKNQQLAVGGNIGYVFGSMTNERKSNLVGSASGGIDQNILKVNALHYELGFYYKQKFNERHAYTLSAVIEPQQQFNAHQQWYLFSSSFVDNPNYYTKLDSTESVKGTITLAPSTTLGLNYTFSFSGGKKDQGTRHSELSLHTSMNITNWGEFRTDFGDVTSNPGYINTNKLTVGIQYIPETAIYTQTTKNGFFQTMRFRAGYYQYSLPVVMNGNSITDMGTTLGFGIPIRIQRSLSSVNIGFTAGKRGSGIAGDLNEKYIGINAGVVFAPANFERWFVKRKYD